jgi:hypothetical protein
MTSEPGPVASRVRTARRVLAKTLRVIGGIVGGTILYFFCERMFAGYHQYGTQYITYAGLVIVMAVGGYAWIIDHRRLDAEEPDGDQ